MTFSASWALAVASGSGVRTLARRKSRQTSKPSFRGSITSSRIRSQPGSRATSRLASSPSPDHLDLVALLAQVQFQPEGDVRLVFDNEYAWPSSLPAGQDNREGAALPRLALHLTRP